MWAAMGGTGGRNGRKVAQGTGMAGPHLVGWEGREVAGKVCAHGKGNGTTGMATGGMV